MSADTPTVSAKELIHRCAPAIAWVRDADHTLLVDMERGRSWSLQGVEAAIWDWLASGTPYERVVRFLCLVLRTSEEEAKDALSATLDHWQDAGITHTIKDGKSGDQHNL